MVLKKDKQKVIDEVLDEAHLKRFLTINPPEGVDADYNTLEKAYRGTTADYFNSFLDLFIAEGRDINARNPAGKTLLQVISEHGPAQDYIEALKQHGAQ